MAINRRRFLALTAIGVPAVVVGKRLGILACLKSYFSALRSVSLTAESTPKSFVPLELELERAREAVQSLIAERQKQLRAEVERGRFAGELHDGALQSMFAVAMQLDVLRRVSTSQAASVAQELGRIHDLLLEEARKLRELMQQMKPLDVEANNLRPHLMELVERFQRETGITAQFVCESTVVAIRPRWVCETVARIVQEGLANVRKHSGASHVLVQFDRGNGYWRLTIDDDGRGFPFSGCFSGADLEADGKGLVIKECVRSIDGELTLESIAGRGSRLVIIIPQRRQVGLQILQRW